MNFLAPWYIPALAAAATIPPLVLLYFLKLKRREVPIASTLLWRRAVEDLQVNSPFQRLRNNLLLILQLLILAAAILAISEPMLAGHRGVDKALVLMIDHSGSMAADEGGQSRLELAKKEAIRTIDEMSAEQRAMIIGFADRAQVLAPFSDDKAALRRAVESIRQSDAPGRLTEAMALAEAHSTPVGEVGSEVEIAESQYIVLTDGRLADAAQTVVQRGTMEIVRIGTSTENVGIVNLDVRRNYETPELLSVLARVRNFGAQPATRDLSLFVDGELKDARSLPPLAGRGGPALLAQQEIPVPPEGSDAVVPFELTLATAARIEVRLSGSDSFAADDRAFAVVAPPRPVTALLVTPDGQNKYLRRLLPSLPLSRYDIWSTDEYEKKPDADLIQDGRCKYDVVIFDSFSTNRLPPGNYIFFGAAPLIPDVDLGDLVRGKVFLDWDETHPVLRHVSVGSMLVLSWHNLKMPAQATTLIEAANGPVVSLLARDRRQYLVFAFNLLDDERNINSTWGHQWGFIVCMYNAVRYLAGSSTTGQQPAVAPGEAFTVAARPGVSSLKVTRPDGTTDTTAVKPTGLATYGRTDRIGIYSITPALPGDEARAVNLLDETESWVAPNEQFQIAAGQVQARTGKDLVNRPLWPYMLGLMGAILLFEWFVYNKRVFI